MKAGWNEEPGRTRRVSDPMTRPKPIVLAAIAAAAVLLLIVIVMIVRSGGGNEDRLSDEETETASADTPAERCSSQRTYDVIKRELFRQAARVRGSDQAAFDRIATHAAVRMDRPVLRSQDEGLGTVGCSGLLVLDLPPGVAVVGGRRSLSAEINYVLQAAADGSGDVVMLNGADAIIVPLATLARTGSDVPALAPEAPPEDELEGLDEAAAPPAEPAEPAPGPEPRNEPEPTASANPSFDCRFARTRSEIAVCNDSGLAALDRQMAAQYNRAVSNSDPRQRRLLQSTRTRFLRFRDACRSDDCIADVYRGRMREIRDIMAGRWRPPS